jgi:hypothetical protein
MRHGWESKQVTKLRISNDLILKMATYIKKH